MRLHRLRVVAFGPFAEPAEVDFDELGAAGLFLLTGPTGAGKSSVLDAVCFALYGAVPGDRNTARHLRCDLAAPGVAPSVALELTLSGRRFRLTRSPVWERPRKRGTGTTRQQASVVVQEWAGGDWAPVTNRMDEAGDLIGELVGLTLTQFCQVAMLPQGQFQAFLRAGSDERRTLLSRLFRTARFDAVEGWLRDRRVELRRESSRVESAVASALNRVAESAGAELPAWDQQALDVPAEEGDLLSWSQRLLDTARAEQVERSLAIAPATESAERADAALGRAVRTAELQARHAQALARRAELTRAEPSISAVREQVAAAVRAEGTAPAEAHAAALRAEAAEAHRSLAQARAALADVFGCAQPEELDDIEAYRAREREATARAARIGALAPRVALREQLAERISTAGADRGAAIHELEQVSAALETVPAEIEAAQAEITAASAAAEALPGARAEVERLDRQRAAAQAVSNVSAQLAEAQGRLRAVQVEVLTAQESLIELRERRLDGMAAEIAGGLAAGCACPVCGSAEHPAPARSAAEAPDAAMEKAALAALDDAKAVQLAHDGAVRDLEKVLAGHQRVAEGHGVATLQAQTDMARNKVEELEVVAGAGPTARQRLDKAQARQRELTGRQGDLGSRIAGLSAAVEGWTAEATALTEELSAALDGLGSVAELADVLARQRALAEAWRRAAEALACYLAAELRRHEADRRAEAAARDAGFDTAADARAALINPRRREQLVARVRDHEVECAAISTSLAEPDLVAAAAAPSPDVEAIRRSREQAADALSAARVAAQVASTRVDRLGDLHSRLAATLDAWAPVRQRWHEVADLTALIEGKHPDNQWQMRLSAFVLAHRLGQVVAAANERLAAMSDDRYQLEHVGQRGAGQSRGGLSLLVRDDWSGETRDPSTLSGGETFVVSLALALGLADVITQEAGGAALDTLFVDEGFGSLDADTLDDVLDTLDSLRAGGRVVGVVSHVAEMADRIPTQLKVAKGRTGSTLR